MDRLDTVVKVLVSVRSDSDPRLPRWHAERCRVTPMRDDGKLAKAAKRRIKDANWYHRREEVAKELGVTPDTVKHIFNGSGFSGLSLRVFQKLSNLVGLTPDELLLEDEELEASVQQEAERVHRQWNDDFAVWRLRRAADQDEGPSPPNPAE
jgi:transcriptional regulator with XRE-family HTH domain